MIHLIIFLVGVLAAVLFSESLITSTRAFIGKKGVESLPQTQIF